MTRFKRTKARPQSKDGKPSSTYRKSLPGCGSVARTLCKLGLLGSSSTEVVEKLDAAIDPILDRFNQNRSLRDHPRHDVGIEGDQWCEDVIRYAIKTDDSKKYLKKLSVVNGGCPALLGDGDFAVDGHLNHAVGDQGHGITNIRQSVAIKNGRVYSSGLHTDGVPISVLGLDDNGRPSYDKGYMKRILKVYRVHDH